MYLAVSQPETSETTSTEAASTKAKSKASNLFQNLKRLSHSRHSSELPKQAQTLEVGATVEPTAVPETKIEPTLAPTKSGGLLGKIRKAVYTRSQSFSQGFASKPAMAPLAVPPPVIEDTSKNVEDLKVPPPTTALDPARSAEVRIRIQLTSCCSSLLTTSQTLALFPESFCYITECFMQKFALPVPSFSIGSPLEAFWGLRNCVSYDHHLL